MDDLSRLRHEYADRARRLAGSDIYSPFNQANLFTIHSRQRAVLSALRRHGCTDFSNRRILEMGCGGGGVLAEYQFFGAPAASLFGVDLLFDRLLHASAAMPGVRLAAADGQSLPFPDGMFDLVLQYTALSSILDPHLRRSICSDMLRVVKLDGLILSYDFWLNPTNRQTRGLHPREIRQLFPGCQFSFYKLTLAPPLARRIVPFSWGLAFLLERMGVFNTHYLALIWRHQISS